MKTIHQNLQDAVKGVLRGKFIPVYAYIKKEERSQIKLIFHLKTWEKEQIKRKESRRNEIIKLNRK